ncbi:MAG: DUF6923 family protein [Arachnia sp.]
MSVVTAVAGVLAVAGSGGPAAASPGDAFGDADSVVFVSQNDPTGLFGAEADAEGSVALVPEGEVTQLRYNALAFNPSDGFLYAVVSGLTSGVDDAVVGDVIRIGQEGQWELVDGLNLAEITGASGTFNAGTWGEVGTADADYYIVRAGSSPTIYVVDISTGALVRQIDTGGPLGYDMLYADGFIWTVLHRGNGYAEIARVDPVSGATEYFALPQEVAPGTFGGQWVFGNGNFGLLDNGGRLYQISVDAAASSTPIFTVVAAQDAPESGNNDAASRPGNEVDLAVAVSPVDAQTSPDAMSGAAIVVTNRSPTARASAYTLQITVPEGFEVDRPSLPPSCRTNDVGIVCTVPSLPAGGTDEFTILGVSSGAAGCLDFSARVVGNDADPNPGNDHAGTSVCTADISLTSSVTASGIDSVHYDIAVTNNGAAGYTPEVPIEIAGDLTGVLDDLPDVAMPSVTYSGSPIPTQVGEGAALSGGVLEWSGALQSGETVTLAFSAATPDGAIRGDTRAVGTVCAGVGSAQTCDELTVLLPRLELSITSQGAAPEPGERVGFTISATNTGLGAFGETGGAAWRADLSDVVDDAEVDLASVVTTAGTAEVTARALDWEGHLTPGASASVSFDATYRGGGNRSLVSIACVAAHSNPPAASTCVERGVAGSLPTPTAGPDHRPTSMPDASATPAPPVVFPTSPPTLDVRPPSAQPGSGAGVGPIPAVRPPLAPTTVAPIQAVLPTPANSPDPTDAATPSEELPVERPKVDDQGDAVVEDKDVPADEPGGPEDPGWGDPSENVGWFVGSLLLLTVAAVALLWAGPATPGGRPV